MIKATTTTLCLAFLLAAAIPLLAQPTPAQIAEEEAVRRQEAVILLRKTLAEAQDSQKKNDLTSAARLYEEAYTLVQRIGIGIDQEKKQTFSGMASVRLQLADRAQREGNLTEADVQVSRVLKIDPKNQMAQSFKKANDKAIEQQKGRVPSKETLALVPEIKSNKTKNSTLVQDGIVLYEMGKLDEAEAIFRRAAKEDPENRGAFYYLALIPERRYEQLARQREIAAKGSMVEVEKAWNPPTQGNSLPTPNPFARTNLVHTGTGRQTIFSKLDKIVLDEVFFPGISLLDVAKYLNDQSMKRDPDKKGGINFFVSSSVDASSAAGGFVLDPTTQQPIPAPPTEPIDLNNVIVRIDPPLRNVRLADVLDAIIMASDKQIKYSINDFMVFFSQKTPEAQQLYSRTFKVNQNSFLQGLESVSGISLSFTGAAGGQGGGGGGGGGGAGGGQNGQGGIFSIPIVDVTGLGGQSGQGGQGGGGGGGGAGGAGGQQAGIGITGLTRTNTMDAIQLMVRNFFTVAGVDLGGTNSLTGAAGKAVFYNDRSGDLYVRATMQDLDIIEAAIHVLDATPPQVLIEAKFAEISQADSKALGFDWYLGNTLIDQGRMGFQGGTAPSFSGDPTINAPANPSGIFPGTAGTPTVGPALTDQILSAGLRNTFRNTSGNDSTIPAVLTGTGILTDPQFRMVMRALEQRGGADILSAPKVLALSGRQAQVQAVDVRTVITGLQNGAGTGGGGGAAVNAGAAGAGGAAATTAFTFAVQSFPFGPSLNVIPYVATDGYTVQMTLIPSHTEFLGYDDVSSRFRNQAVIAVGTTVGTPITQEQPLPRIRVRQVITHAVVWDGQTVSLGGLISEDVNKTKDKVPVLGDIPYLGRFFRSESSSTVKKNLIIFVTPTIIDPAGNRVHTPDNLPYDPNTVPSQRSVER